MGLGHDIQDRRVRGAGGACTGCATDFGERNRPTAARDGHGAGEAFGGDEGLFLLKNKIKIIRTKSSKDAENSNVPPLAVHYLQNT